MLKFTTGYVGSLEFEPLDKLKIGDIAQLDVIGNKVVAIKSNGLCPFGVVVKKIKVLNKKSRTIKRHAVRVIFHRVALKTDNYDVFQKYPVNANLFVNEDGKFTTKLPSPNHPAVGSVIEPLTDTDNLLHVFWF